MTCALDRNARARRVASAPLLWCATPMWADTASGDGRARGVGENYWTVATPTWGATFVTAWCVLLGDVIGWGFALSLDRRRCVGDALHRGGPVAAVFLAVALMLPTGYGIWRGMVHVNHRDHARLGWVVAGVVLVAYVATVVAIAFVLHDGHPTRVCPWLRD